MIYMLGLIMHLLNLVGLVKNPHIANPGISEKNEKGETKCCICGAWFVE